MQLFLRDIVVGKITLKPIVWPVVQLEFYIIDQADECPFYCTYDKLHAQSKQLSYLLSRKASSSIITEFSLCTRVRDRTSNHLLKSLSPLPSQKLPKPPPLLSLSKAPPSPRVLQISHGVKVHYLFLVKTCYVHHIVI